MPVKDPRGSQDPSPWDPTHGLFGFASWGGPASEGGPGSSTPQDPKICDPAYMDCSTHHAPAWLRSQATPSLRAAGYRAPEGDMLIRAARRGKLQMSPEGWSIRGSQWGENPWRTGAAGTVEPSLAGIEDRWSARRASREQGRLSHLRRTQQGG